MDFPDLSFLKKSNRIQFSMTTFIPPLSFSIVEDNIYRSSYPSNKTLPFLKTLNLRSLICLYPSDIRQDLRDFASKNNITLFEVNVGHNQEPFVVMSEAAVAGAIKFVLGRPLFFFERIIFFKK